MTTIYVITSDLIANEYRPTKEGALRDARAAHKDAPDQFIEVIACEIDTSLPIRELCCLLLAGTGYATKQTTLLTLEAKR